MTYENQFNELTGAEQIDLMGKIAGCVDGTVYTPATDTSAFLYILYSGKIVMGLYQWAGVNESGGRFIQLSIIS